MKRTAILYTLLAILSAAATAAEPAAEKKDPADQAWKKMFNGKDLEGWTVTQFGGEGEVEVKEGVIVMGMGEPMTGITWKGSALPKTNYELVVEARRTDGHDFFATTTFPIGEEHASFVTGGWAGTVVGISSVNFYDASENPTTTFKDFKDNQWYTLRIRVSDARLECWIDDEQMVNLEREEHKFSTRIEVELSKPMGISSYMTSSEIRAIKLRNLRPAEIEAAAQSKE